jgi:hypothetical protein
VTSASCGETEDALAVHLATQPAEVIDDRVGILQIGAGDGRRMARPPAHTVIPSSAITLMARLHRKEIARPRRFGKRGD